MRSHDNIKCSSLFQWRTIYTTAYWHVCPGLAQIYKFWPRTNQALALASIRQKLFSLPRCRGLRNLPSLASVARTYDSLWSIIFQHNNANPHTAHWTQQLLHTLHWDLLDHQPHFFDCCSNIWDVADSTITGKWKWLFMDDCGYGSLITTARKFVNSCQ